MSNESRPISEIVEERTNTNPIRDAVEILKDYGRTLASAPIPSSRWAIPVYGVFKTPDGFIIGCEDEKLAEEYRNNPEYKEIIR